MKIYLDGKFVDSADAKVSVFDHGLLYGDGVFEGLRFYNRKIFKLREHLERLYDSARHIALVIPQELAALAADTQACVAACGMDDGYIRLVVTRGAGELGRTVAGASHHHQRVAGVVAKGRRRR